MFSQYLVHDPTTTRCILFDIAITHDFESYDEITKGRLYHNICASLMIILEN